MITIPYDKIYINLDVIANSGQCFRWEKLNNSSEMESVYKIPILNDYIIIHQKEKELIFECSKEELSKWIEYLDLDFTYVLPYHIVENDSFIQSAIEYGKGMRILNQDLWETLISFILSQNTNIPKIKKCISKLIEVYGKFPSYQDILNEPEKVTYIGAGYRDKYLISAAFRYEDLQNRINFKHLSYFEFISILKNIHGVGDKIANCVALFSNHYFEACPIDVWMQRIINEEYNEIKPKWMISNYAGYLQQLAFYYKRNKL